MGTKVNFAIAALSAGLAAIGLASAPAAAATYVFDKTDLGQNTTVGTHDEIIATFDTVTEEFTWSSTFGTNDSTGLLADGAWLVVSDGPNPKFNEQEYVIFYLDGEENVVSLYDYNGENKSTSWEEGTYLGSTELTVTETGDQVTFDFSLDMTDINDLTGMFGENWEGTSFEESIGIWFHGVDGLETAYNPDGSLSEFSYTDQGWYDTKDQSTEKVPEPGTVAALGLFAGLGVIKKLWK